MSEHDQQFQWPPSAEVCLTAIIVGTLLPALYIVACYLHKPRQAIYSISKGCCTYQRSQLEI